MAISRVSYYQNALTGSVAASAMIEESSFNDFVAKSDFKVTRYITGAEYSDIPLIKEYAPTGGNVYIADRLIYKNERKHLYLLYEPATEDSKIGILYVQCL